jgi:hypothetical protein
MRSRGGLTQRSAAPQIGAGERTTERAGGSTEMSTHEERRGKYVRLSQTFYKDEALMSVGPQAQLLYLRCLALASELSSDGLISARQLPLVGHDLRKPRSLARQLVGVGLWLDNARGDGWIIRNYLKWNRSRAEIFAASDLDRDRKANARGNHVRPDNGRTGPSRPVGKSALARASTDTDTETDTAVRPDPFGSGPVGQPAGTPARDAGRADAPEPIELDRPLEPIELANLERIRADRSARRRGAS